MIYLAVLLVLVGVFLMGIEGIIPGFGIFGFTGLACGALGVFLMAEDYRMGLIYSATFVALSPVLIPVMAKMLKPLPLAQKLIDKNTLRTEDGYSAKNAHHDTLVGQKGVAISDLRPSGSVLLDNGEKLDVITQGDFIERGSRVRLLKAESTWFVVQKI